MTNAGLSLRQVVAYVAWAAFLGLLAAILMVAGTAPTSLFGETLSAVSIAIMFGHAILALGWVDALAFAGIMLVVTFGVENIGAATGFPFGSYHFVVEEGLPHIGLIPPIVGPLYFAMGYAAYIIGSLLTNRRAHPSFHALAGTSLVAAFAMTAWDIVMDRQVRPSLGCGSGIRAGRSSASHFLTSWVGFLKCCWCLQSFPLGSNGAGARLILAATVGPFGSFRYCSTGQRGYVRLRPISSQRIFIS